MNPNYLEYNPDANDNDSTLCLNFRIEGCTDATAFNYNVYLQMLMMEVVPVVLGCLDNGFEQNGIGQVSDIDGDGLPAFNYDSLANTDDGSCIPIIEGCTDANFIEYWSYDEINLTITELDSIPNTEDESCSILS